MSGSITTPEKGPSLRPHHGSGELNEPWREIIAIPPNASPFRTKFADLFGVSYHSIGILAAGLEAISLLIASIVAGTIYHLAYYGQLGDTRLFAGIGIANSFAFVLLAKGWGLYQLPALVAPRRHFGQIATACVGVFLVLILVVFLIKAGASLSRGSILAFAACEFATLMASRWFLKKFITLAVAGGTVRGRRAILIGDQTEFATWVPEDLLRSFAVQEVARVTLRTSDDADVSVGQDLRKAVELARMVSADEFAVALKWEDTELLAQVRQHLRKSPLPVRLLPCSVVRSVLEMRAATATQLVTIELQRAPLTTFERLLKRGFDIVAAAAGLLLMAPLLAILGLAVKLDSPGPIMFRQRRNGFNGRPFVIYKFRTMKVLEDGAKVRQAQRDDPRVTRIGRILRKWSIDELPQLLNVLKGEMSLVGPRPHALAHDHHYMGVVSNYAFRHHVKPGITGWAQVNGFRGETLATDDMEQRVELDLWYITNWSLWLDMRIVVRTCLELAKGRAY